MLGISKEEETPAPQHPLSPMGEACSRMDLTAIHQILVMTHYRDDEGTNEVYICVYNDSPNRPFFSAKTFFIVLPSRLGVIYAMF